MVAGIASVKNIEVERMNENKKCKHTWKLERGRSRFGLNWNKQVCAKCGVDKYE